MLRNITRTICFFLFIFFSKSTDERKDRLDKSQVDLDSAISLARSHFAKMPSQNERQLIALHALIDQLQHHYSECQKVANAALNTIQKLEKDYNNN